ncbi:MAG: ATP phosphoribosyltransferase regulatory subunit [Mangrovicoccus sp.]
MASKAEIRAEAARLQAHFEALGAVPAETNILQPADVLLDLYGEDIRARAYVTSDPLYGEMMLRPDFTAPVVLQHLESDASQAVYTYSGTVFRRQETDPRRPTEFMQVGLERIGDPLPEIADAEVFARFSEVLAPYNLRAATGDIGILAAAVAGLETSEARRAALARHIWRPRRFKAMLDRFAGRLPAQKGRAELLVAWRAGIDMVAENGPEIGKRSADEVKARLDRLSADEAEPPIAEAQVRLVEQILGLKDRAPVILEQLHDIAVDLPAIAPAVTRLSQRLDALERVGIKTADLDFEASYGRTTLEYYDGFVFGFFAEGRPDLPPVASGGRYDALTRVLGRGVSMPAVGGVIRPEVILGLAEGRL